MSTNHRKHFSSSRETNPREKPNTSEVNISIWNHLKFMQWRLSPRKFNVMLCSTHTHIKCWYRARSKCIHLINGENVESSINFINWSMWWMETVFYSSSSDIDVRYRSKNAFRHESFQRIIKERWKCWPSFRPTYNVDCTHTIRWYDANIVKTESPIEMKASKYIGH